MRSIRDIAVALSITLGVVLTPLSVSAGRRGEIRREVRKFEQLLHYLSEHHIDSLDIGGLVDGAIGSLIAECDPYSRYLTASDNRSLHHLIEQESSIGEVSMVSEGVGYIELKQFGRGASRELLQAVDSLDHPERLILDLRGNSGGVVGEATAIAGEFLPSGSTIIKYRDGKGVIREITNPKAGSLLSTQLCIIIDNASASASEIVVAALQGVENRVIVGERSHGKGLILRELRFSDNTTALIAIAEYLTPREESIQHPYRGGKIDGLEGGIKPDIDLTISGKEFAKMVEVFNFIFHK